jgi:NitT/TauT family transport system permease protein/sulfonate transport system permease protein
MSLINKLKSNIEPVVYGIIGIGIVFVVWHISIIYTDIGRVLPSPLTVFSSFIKYLITPMGKYTIVQHALFSLLRVFVGFSLSALTGIILGIGMGYSKLINAIARPIFNIIRPIPGLAWIPMAILWFGIGEASKYFIIFMGGFAQVVLNTIDGSRRVDPSLMGAAKVLGADKKKVFFYVVIPSCVPYIFAGLQVSLSTSWMAVLAAEMVSSREGSGWIIVTGMNNGNTTQILIGMISIGIVGLILATTMRLIEKELCSWAIRGR